MSRISLIQALVRNGLYYLTEHADDEVMADDFDIDMENSMTTDFWAGETCEYCGGEIVEKRVTLHRKVKGNYLLLENIPAGVCMQCGTRYYAANVLKTIEETVRGRQKATREVVVPVYAWPG